MLRHIGIGLLGIAAFFAAVFVLGLLGTIFTTLAHFAIPIVIAFIVVFFILRHFRSRANAGGINPNPFAFVNRH